MVKPLAIKQDGVGLRVGLVYARSNADITELLVDGCTNALVAKGVKRHDVIHLAVSRPFKLAFAADQLIHTEQLDAVVCVGCIIRDDCGSQFDSVSECVANSIMKLNLESAVPAVYALLTCTNVEQARKYVGIGGGVSANHGFEWAKTAIELANLSKYLQDHQHDNSTATPSGKQKDDHCATCDCP